LSTAACRSTTTWPLSSSSSPSSLTAVDRQIAFTDFHPASALPARGSSPIQVLDPVNFDNNVARHYTPSDRDRLVTAATEALDASTTAYYEPAKGQAVELWQDVLGTSFRAAA
jgi:hypothetical protein